MRKYMHVLCAGIKCRRWVQALSADVECKQSAFLLEKTRLRQQQHNDIIILRTFITMASSILQLASSKANKL